MSPSPDSPMPRAAESAAHSLQFDKAETPSRQCAFCAASLPGEYHQVGGAEACADCAQKVRATQARPGAGAIFRALVYGWTGMMGCAAAYAAFLYVSQGWTIGFVAIFIGMGVGRAVRWGAGGLGGKRLQWMAVAFTYFASTFAYVPSLHEELMKRDREALVKLQQLADAEAKKRGIALFPLEA